MIGNRDLALKVLGDPSVYPDAFQSWIQRIIPGNPLIQLDETQVPSPEKLHLVGATSEPAFQHGSNFGGSARTVGFYRDPFGIVHLCGLVGATYAAGQTIFQLPAGDRPEMKEAFAVITDTGVGRVDVDEVGDVIFVSGGTTYCSLSGITFRAF